MRRLGLLVAAAALALAPALHADDQRTPGGRPRPSAEPRQERLQRRLERLRERAAGAPSAAPPAASTLPATSASAAASDSLRAELSQKWAALAATRPARRERHRTALLHEVGAHLSEPDVKAELALHASRVAELARIEFLAQNARAGAERQKLLARVAKASERETERHRRRMARLLAQAAPAPANGGAPAAPAGASSSEAPR